MRSPTTNGRERNCSMPFAKAAVTGSNNHAWINRLHSTYARYNVLRFSFPQYLMTQGLFCASNKECMCKMTHQIDAGDHVGDHRLCRETDNDTTDSSHGE